MADDGNYDLSVNFSLNTEKTDLSANFTLNHLTTDLSANVTIQHTSQADLSANFAIQRTASADLSANFLVGIDIHAFVKQFRFGHDEISTNDLHNELTIWLNSQHLVNKTFKAANIVPLGLTGNFLVVFIVS